MGDMTPTRVNSPDSSVRSEMCSDRTAIRFTPSELGQVCNSRMLVHCGSCSYLLPRNPISPISIPPTTFALMTLKANIGLLESGCRQRKPVCRTVFEKGGCARFEPGCIPPGSAIEAKLREVAVVLSVWSIDAQK
jgi:hypothetical protein